jgi:hypothetical protein
VVGKHIIYGGALAAGELFSQLVSDNTRYLVLDLDRTFHLGRNLGELLGWDVAAINSYGEDYVEQMDAKRGADRFLLAKDRPLAVAHYFLRNARLWAYPGLLYLACCQLPHRNERIARLLQRMLGHDPVAAGQHVVRLALMHQLHETPLHILRRRAAQIWSRLAGDLVIERQDLEQLRARCPGLKIVLSSASPQPVLEVARDQLGIDDIAYTSIEEVDGYLSAPYLQSHLFMMLRKPRRIAPPRSFVENVHFAKIEALAGRYPDLFDPAVESVAVSDTSHGEDYDFASFFTRVADVNSPTPFPPLVATDSPLRQIHSCHLLTRDEKQRRRTQPDYLDPRRRHLAVRPRTLTYDGEDLLRLCQRPLSQLQTLAEQYRDALDETQTPRAKLGDRVNAIVDELARIVEHYNAAAGKQRRPIARALHRFLRRRSLLLTRLRGAEWPLYTLSAQINDELKRARALLEQR